MRFPVSKPSIGEDEINAVAAVLDGGWITQGPVVEEFEHQLARELNVEHVVACASGTAALHLALADLGLSPGDEVLVPDLTYIATANAVLYVGAQPVLVDVDEDTWNLNLDHAERLLTARTKAIVVVHLYGVCCEMERVQNFAYKHGLHLIEDAAEALGAKYDDLACGTMGGAGCFSFYGNKIMTTGEGGAVVTRSAERAQRLRLLRGQGQSPVQRFVHIEMGFNYRMTDIHAALGLAQLVRLPQMLARRQAVVDAYRTALTGVLVLQDIPDGTTAAPWLFTGLLPRHTKRASVVAELAMHGIETRPTFVPLHRQPYLAVEGGNGRFPVAGDIGDRGLSLPTYTSMVPADALEIAAVLRKVVQA